MLGNEPLLRIRNAFAKSIRNVYVLQSKTFCFISVLTSERTAERMFDKCVAHCLFTRLFFRDFAWLRGPNMPSFFEHGVFQPAQGDTTTRGFSFLDEHSRSDSPH